MRDKLTGLFDDIQDVSGQLNRLQRDVDAEMPIAGDVGTIKQQQEEFKGFLKGRVDPIQKQVENINKTGQGLVQSASPGVSTSVLESDMEMLNDTSAQLNEKITERERALDVALLQSGKFKDAVVSLMDWLTETQDLVSNQKPPSSDYKVAKAQIAEQKVLQKMLDDRAENVESVKRIGDDLIKKADEAERAQVKRDVDDLMSRWNKLTGAADERKRALEGNLTVSKDFHEKLEPFSEWLENTEKKMSSLDNISSDPPTLRNQIQDQHEINSDIQGHRSDAEDVVNSGKELLKHSIGDDVDAVREKIDAAKDRYQVISDKSSERLGQMEGALPVAEEVQETRQKLLDWIQRVEPELRGKEQVGPQAEAQVMVNI